LLIKEEIMTRFLSRLSIALLVPVALGVSLTAQAANDLARRAQAATEVLQDLQRIPEQAIPPTLLDSAYAVAVIPNVVKGGLIISGSFGKGVLLVRQSDGSWSNPAFIKMGNVGFGWQAGVQGADLVLVFKNRRSIDNIASGKFTLGTSASASAGPVGRTAQAMTDGEFKAEIYTYSRSRGLFAGVSLDGGAITIDKVANAEWYGNASDGSAARIFDDENVATPAGAQPLLDALTAMAPRLNWTDSALANQPAAVEAQPSQPQSKTYAIEDGAQSAPETMF
jgi:lipid-binding SYLF domain-containing protein